MDQELICAIADEIIRQLTASGQLCPAPRPQEDPASPEGKASALLDPVSDPDALARMMRSTTARIGVGRCGPRLKTRTLLALRADHAQARDAVFADVDPQVLEQAGLFTVQSRCPDKTTFLTRPDLGRLLSPEAEKTLREKCLPNPDVQIYAADGLSATAIEANLTRILPVLTDSSPPWACGWAHPFSSASGGWAPKSMWPSCWAPRWCVP